MCANNIESLVNNLFGVNIFNTFPSFLYFLSPSSGDMSDKSTYSSLSFLLKVVSADSSF